MSVYSTGSSPAVDRCPLSTVSIALGFSALVLLGLTNTMIQRQFVGVALVGILLGVIGYETWRAQYRISGIAIVLVGTGLVAFGFITLTVGIQTISFRLVLIPAVLGSALLAMGMIPTIRWYTRGLIMVGTGLLFVGVLVSGILDTMSTERIVVVGAMTIVAWESADHGVGLGRQIGRQGRSRTNTAIHAGVTGVVVATLVGLVFIVSRVIQVGLSLTVFVILLVSIGLLIFSLRH